MSVDDNYLYEALTRWNYFPNQKSKGGELPPVFSTRQFTPDVAKLLLAEKPRKGGYDQVEYYATRYNNVSRPLAIPHPVGYAHLVDCICSNWGELEYTSTNESSLIKPEEHSDGRVLVMDYEDPLERTTRTLGLAFGKKFRVHTDITNCFPNIYAHAIPWATVGLAHAKANKHTASWFNDLDRCQRWIKRNETQGVAIGPATSNIVSEAILARIDEKLSKDYSYYRYIDDYTCYSDTYEGGQEFLLNLGDELRKYKLGLNIKKTRIVELPAAVDSDWVVELSNRLPAGFPKVPPEIGSSYSASQVLRFLDYAVNLARQTPDGSVLKFAVKSIVYQLDERAVQPVLEYLLNLCRFYPLLLPSITPLLGKPSVNCWVYAKQLNDILFDNAVNRRSDGMCWALYLMELHGMLLDFSNVEKVIESRDCMAIALLDRMNAFEKEVKAFVDSLDASDFYELDQYWVLLYQRFFAGKGANPYPHENCFQILKDEQVSFVPETGVETPREIAILAAKYGFTDVTETPGGGEDRQ